MAANEAPLDRPQGTDGSIQTAERLSRPVWQRPRRHRHRGPDTGRRPPGPLDEFDIADCADYWAHSGHRRAGWLERPGAAGIVILIPLVLGIVVTLISLLTHF